MNQWKRGGAEGSRPIRLISAREKLHQRERGFTVERCPPTRAGLHPFRAREEGFAPGARRARRVKETNSPKKQGQGEGNGRAGRCSGVVAFCKNRFDTEPAEPGVPGGGIANFRGGIAFSSPRPSVLALDTIEPVIRGEARRGEQEAPPLVPRARAAARRPLSPFASPHRRSGRNFRKEKSFTVERCPPSRATPPKFRARREGFAIRERRRAGEWGKTTEQPRQWRSGAREVGSLPRRGGRFTPRRSRRRRFLRCRRRRRFHRRRPAPRFPPFRAGGGRLPPPQSRR